MSLRASRIGHTRPGGLRAREELLKFLMNPHSGFQSDVSDQVKPHDSVITLRSLCDELKVRRPVRKINIAFSEKIIGSTFLSFQYH